MNQHRSYGRLLCCLLLLGLSASAAKAQQLKPAIYTSVDPTPNRPEIDAYVIANVKKLALPDPAVWGSARQSLLNTAALPGVTPGFLDQYSQSLALALKTAAASKDARIRLNVAVISARISSRNGGSQLAGLTDKLLKDDSDAVVLWAIQSAKFNILNLLQAGNTKLANRLGHDVAVAAEAHSSAAITEEAYRALMLDTGGKGDPLAVLPPSAISGYLPNLVDFLTFRVQLYAVAFPPAAITDTWALSFMVRPAVWAAQSPQAQKQTLQLMLSLLKGADTQNTAATTPEIVDVIKRGGQTFEVVSGSLKNPELEKAAKALASINKDTPAPDITDRIKGIEAAVGGLNLGAAALK